MQEQASWLEKASTFSRDFLARFRIRSESIPIDSRDRLFEFVSSRAAFVTQKTLYGYLKTRMGTRYPTMFEDDIFVQSINIAKMNVFAACLSDLTIWAVAHALAGLQSDETRLTTAKACYIAGMAENTDEAPEGFNPDAAIADFEKRLADVEWETNAKQRETFSESPAALFKWAPIAPNLKKYDREIVENSIILTWFEIRERFQKRLAPTSIEHEIGSNPD